MSVHAPVARGSRGKGARTKRQLRKVTARRLATEADFRPELPRSTDPRPKAG